MCLRLTLLCIDCSGLQPTHPQKTKRFQNPFPPADHSEADKHEDEKPEEVVPRRPKVSSISLNIPAAGLGSRPPSVVSTSTLDEGGFNEPCPEIKARLRPHEDSIREPSESSTTSSESDKKPPEPIYAVPHKLSGLGQSMTSTDSSASQVTVIAQKSFDSDVMYNSSGAITNSVLAELESQESFEKNCKEMLEAVACERSVPFLMVRESLKSDRVTILAEVQKAEANILDLNDVEFVDASDNEQDGGSVKKGTVKEADAMTPAEAENLLSSK